MMNLYDILTKAQGGAAMDQLSRQFRLTPEQTQTSIEALLPAFSMGLKQLASTHQGLALLFNTMANSNYRSLYDNPAAAFSPQGTQAGNDVLSMMFGNEMSRAIADQAAKFSGVGTSVMQQMMPLVASMLMGGLFRTMASGQAGVPDYMGDILRQMAGGREEPRQQRREPPPGPGQGDLFSQMMRSWLEGMMGGQMRPQSPSQEEPEQPRKTRKGSSSESSSSGSGGLDDLSNMSKQLDPGAQGAALFGHLLDTGREIQKAHLENMQHVFDAFMGRSKRD